MNRLELQTNSYWNIKVRDATDLLIKEEIDELCIEFPSAHEIVSEKEMIHLINLAYHEYNRTLTKTEDGYKLTLRRK